MQKKKHFVYTLFNLPALFLKILKQGKSYFPIFKIFKFYFSGILERINKLNYLSSAESSDEIIFPRVKRRLLQLKEESQDTFDIPELAEVERCILTAKINAVKISQECGMFLNLYGDNDLHFPGTETINAAAENDYERNPSKKLEK